MIAPTATPIDMIPDEAVRAAMSKVLLTKAEALDALAAALPHLSAPCAVEVAKLDWKTERADKTNGLDTERTGFHEFGYYSITGRSGCYYVSTFDNMGRMKHVGHHGFGSIAEAKAAAQSDFERRILSCIVTKPATLTNEGTKTVDVSAGLERAAIFIDQRIADYVREHGMTDPETGTVEFPGWGDEYVSELEELAEGIRVLSPAEPAQGEPDFSKSIAEVVKEESLGGAACGWKSCAGCLETSDGYHCGEHPYSETFKAHVGSGCSACGGIGVVWEHYPKAALAEMPQELPAAAPTSEAGK